MEVFDFNKRGEIVRKASLSSVLRLLSAGSARCKLLVAALTTVGALLSASATVYISTGGQGVGLDDSHKSGTGWDCNGRTLTIDDGSRDFTLSGGDADKRFKVIVQSCKTLTLGDNAGGLTMMGCVTFKSGASCTMSLKGDSSVWNVADIDWWRETHGNVFTIEKMRRSR